MLVLILRTDKPEAEIGLFENNERLGYIAWQAHRQLAETIHLKIKQLHDENAKKLTDLNGIVVFKGPGSFTGLRIGLSVANGLSAALKLNIVSEAGENWIENGLSRLKKGENETVALPEYGSPPHVTLPKH